MPSEQNSPQLESLKRQRIELLEKMTAESNPATNRKRLTEIDAQIFILERKQQGEPE